MSTPKTPDTSLLSAEQLAEKKLRQDVDNAEIQAQKSRDAATKEWCRTNLEILTKEMSTAIAVPDYADRAEAMQIISFGISKMLRRCVKYNPGKYNRVKEDYDYERKSYF
jgi:hypothetical protein